MHHNSRQFHRDQAADPEAGMCGTTQTRRHHCRSGLACVGNRVEAGQRHEHRKADERRSAANRHSLQCERRAAPKVGLGRGETVVARCRAVRVCGRNAMQCADGLACLRWLRGMRPQRRAWERFASQPETSERAAGTAAPKEAFCWCRGAMCTGRRPTHRLPNRASPPARQSGSQPASAVTKSARPSSQPKLLL